MDQAARDRLKKVATKAFEEFSLPERVHAAVGLDLPEALEELLEGGLDPEMVFDGYEGLAPRTPLIWAAINDGGKTAELLVRWGADLDQRTVEGFTPAHVAARVGAAKAIS